MVLLSRGLTPNIDDVPEAMRNTNTRKELEILRPIRLRSGQAFAQDDKKGAIGNQLMSFLLAKLLKRRIAAQAVPRWIKP